MFERCATRQRRRTQNRITRALSVTHLPVKKEFPFLREEYDTAVLAPWDILYSEVNRITPWGCRWRAQKTAWKNMRNEWSNRGKTVSEIAVRHSVDRRHRDLASRPRRPRVYEFSPRFFFNRRMSAMLRRVVERRASVQTNLSGRKLWEPRSSNRFWFQVEPNIKAKFVEVENRAVQIFLNVSLVKIMLDCL